MPRSVVGLDIGGANLKAAHVNRSACLMPFELWKNPQNLSDALSRLLNMMPPFDLLAVTMTGELCDCFETKRQGVQAILDAVRAAAGSTPVQVWRTDGQMVDMATARSTPLLAAAANWLALAQFACRFAPTGPALVIDIGSTTTDIIPLEKGTPVPQGRTDRDRLQSHELVYTGVHRTPVCALLGTGGAAECFATTLDIYLVLESLRENPSCRATADGRPATRAAAHARLARMVCADAETCMTQDTRKLAIRVLQRQVHAVQFAVETVSQRLSGAPQTLILAGSGEFLAGLVVKELPSLSSARIASLSEKLNPALSEVACAYALAVLAAEA